MFGVMIFNSIPSLATAVTVDAIITNRQTFERNVRILMASIVCMLQLVSCPYTCYCLFFGAPTCCTRCWRQEAYASCNILPVSHVDVAIS